MVVDEEIARYGLARELRKCGCRHVEVAGSVDMGLHLLRLSGYDVVFCGLNFGIKKDGEDFLDAASVEFPSTAVVMVSNSIEPTKSLDLILRGAQYCLKMPVFKAHCEVVLANLKFRSADAASNYPALKTAV